MSTTSFAVRKQKKEYKPAPPVTTPPPPRRHSMPASGVGAIATRTKPVPARPSVGSHSLSEGCSSEQRIETTSLATRLSQPTSSDESSKELLTPTLISSSSSWSHERHIPIATNASRGIVKKPPPLPPRNGELNDSLTLVVVETPPPLPVRAYSLTSSTALAVIEDRPALPARTYQNSSPITVQPNIATKTLPLKLTRTMSPTPSEQSVSSNPRSVFTRASSASTVSSSTSTETDGTRVAPLSSKQKPPPLVPKAPHIAELIKALEAKSITQTLNGGVRPVATLS